MSCLDYYNRFLTGLPIPSILCLQWSVPPSEWLSMTQLIISIPCIQFFHGFPSSWPSVRACSSDAHQAHLCRSVSYHIPCTWLSIHPKSGFLLFLEAVNAAFSASNSPSPLYPWRALLHLHDSAKEASLAPFLLPHFVYMPPYSTDCTVTARSSLKSRKAWATHLMRILLYGI